MLANSSSASPGQREIWDYKGTNRPANSDPSLRDYVWQMCVYAELYRSRTGSYPATAILYFLNELYTAPNEPPLTRRPRRAVYEVNFTPQLIQQALQQFDTTAQEIIQCKNAQQWAVAGNPPDLGTCNICDIRWNCPARQGTYLLRYPL